MSLRALAKKVPRLRYFWRQWVFPVFQWWRIHRCFAYDRRRFLRYSMHRCPSKQSALASIIATYHVVEKGLTMPEPRLGFGRDVVLRLISELNQFAEKYGTDEMQFQHALGVIAEYHQWHQSEKSELSNDVELQIGQLLRKFSFPASQQIDMTRDAYFSKANAPFPEFSASRHSVRHFEGSVSLEQIKQAVSLANNAPSACNRQPCRVHVVKDKELIAKCLALQNGNRGFGHLADKLLVLTTDLRCAWETEQKDIFFNAGLYAMNLCYALHFYKVAHCMLNWSRLPKFDEELHSLLKIPIEETPAVLIACGKAPKMFRIANSAKKDSKDSLRIV